MLNLWKMVVKVTIELRKALSIAVLFLGVPVGLWAGYGASSACFAVSICLGAIYASAFFRYGCKIIVDPVFIAIGVIAGACGMYHTLYKVALPETELSKARLFVAMRLPNIKTHCPNTQPDVLALAKVGSEVCITKNLGNQSIAINEIIKSQAHGPLVSFADNLNGLLARNKVDACAEIAAKIEQMCPSAFTGIEQEAMEALRKTVKISGH